MKKSLLLIILLLYPTLAQARDIPSEFQNNAAEYYSEVNYMRGIGSTESDEYFTAKLSCRRAHADYLTTIAALYERGEMNKPLLLKIAPAQAPAQLTAYWQKAQS